MAGPAPATLSIIGTVVPGRSIAAVGYATGRFAARSASRLIACTSGHEHH